MTKAIIQLRQAKQYFKSPGGGLFKRRLSRALDGVDIDVYPNRILAIVGESGSGKSTLARLLLMLRKPTGGEIRYRGTPHSKLTREDMRSFRREVQAIFQDPAASLNPRMTVLETLGHIVEFYNLVEPVDIREFLSGHLEDVGLTPAEDYLERYPHQLSGGQQQRIAIARAMMLSPSMIVADEPLSSLDVSIRAQVLDLMKELQSRTGIGLVIVGHDLGALELVADTVAVMYSGKIVEFGDNVFADPQHPYTRLLLDSQLSMDPQNRRPIRSLKETVEPLTISGGASTGCNFCSRCELAFDACYTSEPLPRSTRNGGMVACHLVESTVNSAGGVK